MSNTKAKTKLYIALVGLPASGKSTTAVKIRESLEKSNVHCAIFNNGDLRRKLLKRNTSYPDFYDRNNPKSTKIREKLALINIYQARNHLRKNGDVAILDATHASSSRREVLKLRLQEHPLLFIECINQDQEILETIVSRKATLSEFSHLSRDEAIASFKQRIEYYAQIYAPLQNEKNFIRFDTLNNRILESSLKEEIPHFDQIRDLLVTDQVKNLFLVRHAESFDNVQNRIGGNAELTPAGREQATKIASHFQGTSLPYIFCSTKTRTMQTASPVSEMQAEGSTLFSLSEFDEIDAGICEGMSYEEIKRSMPEIYQNRQKDKYHYVYPGGEGYVSMRRRIHKGIKKALFLSGKAQNIMIVGHRAVNRMILAHFLYRRISDVPYIYVPQDRYYHIVSTQQKKLFELRWI
ncbi:MAG: bifunctional nucleoside/nucleotide kinase/histidine phosphatase family protein [Thermodesulfobacteriota bacterium]